MSFARLESGEFPTLGRETANFDLERSKHYRNNHSNQTNSNFSKHNGENVQNKHTITNGIDFVTTRVGFQIQSFVTDLASVINDLQIGETGDFILVPISSDIPNNTVNDDRHLLPDLILPCELWHTKVAIDLGLPKFSFADNIFSDESFELLLRHAFYLSAPVIVIDCPDSEQSRLTLASAINDRLYESNKIHGLPLLLFRISFQLRSSAIHYESDIWDCEIQDEVSVESGDSGTQTANQVHSQVSDDGSNLNSNKHNDKMQSSWHQWNSLRAHLTPDQRIGVCLFIHDECTFEDEEEMARWAGEPVRMIIIHPNQFIKSPGHNSLRLNSKCKEFIVLVALKNSLKTSFVVSDETRMNAAKYLQYLDGLAGSLKHMYPDPLREWDDKLQPPLQPLSTNLDSNTYGVFEADRTKYIAYKDAMMSALNDLLERNGSRQEFVLMVLGAGRGPLVDCFIQAIIECNCKCKFKLFALDKNPSSVQSLLFKQRYQWSSLLKNIQTVVIQSDMRTWEPGVKADIIASELLGSLADNELSPECLDGVWKLSYPETICIPQEYSSYISPVCSYSMHQKLYTASDVDSYAFDQIYVTKLTNYYSISDPQRLIQFEHSNLSLPPSSRCNKRYKKLEFRSKMDTVCHGFVGYFSSKLFGSHSIATVPSQKTPNMESWFPAFIPLESPVQLPKQSLLEIHFWRKESNSSVWYEWTISSPSRSRIHGQNNSRTAMSKFI